MRQRSQNAHPSLFDALGTTLSRLSESISPTPPKTPRSRSGQILAELSVGNDPIIKNTAGGNDYEFRDARYAMALRVLLEKDAARERVRRVDATNI